MEDEEAISSLIEMSLVRAGYRCETADNGLTAADLIEENTYDLVLLDVMLPGLDGYELMEYLRPTGTPVIFLTAKGSLGDRVKGLRLGADDYIVKPFEVPELIARVESVLRRTGRGGQTLRAWDVELDTVARTVKRMVWPVALTPREFDLLELLNPQPRHGALPRDAVRARVGRRAGERYAHARSAHQSPAQKARLAAPHHDGYKIGYKLEREDAP